MVKWRDLRGEWHNNPKRLALIEAEFPYRRVADELIALRAGLGLSQSEFAAKAGMTQSVIARAESGRHPVNSRTLSRLAKAVGYEWRPQFEKVEAQIDTTPVRTIDIPTPIYGIVPRRPVFVVMSGYSRRSSAGVGLVA